MTEHIDEGIEALKNAIVQRTEAEWERHHKALLLARLGSDLASDGFDLQRTLKGKKFVVFIESNLADRVRILQSPHDNPHR